MIRKTKFLTFAVLLSVNTVLAQEQSRLIDGLDVTAEAQYTTSDNITPLWLNANRYGLSSLEKNNGYLRLSAKRDIDADSSRLWRIGYGVDFALTSHFQNTILLQQAYAEVNYKKLTLSAGAKERSVDMKNQELSSGSMAIGINARPIPQIRLDVDYFNVPYTKQLLKMKFYGSFGMTTDGNWQKSVIKEGERYTGNVLYHEKAVFFKIGNAESPSLPLTFVFGIKVASQFGGVTYNCLGRGIQVKTDVSHPEDFGAFMDVLLFKGSDVTDGTSKNTSGNHVGAWDFRLKWHGEGWSAAARFERVFEDQSMMFVQYGIYDHLLGLDLDLPSNPFISSLTIEHMNTRDQSGAILHDQAANIPDKMNGRDNYYNHNLYSGYQHWGQSMGNPLLTSPIYNTDGTLPFKNNRIKAWHLGLAGDPAPWLHWRFLASITKNWGTYDYPFDDPENQNYYLLEASVKPQALKGWQARVGLGFDRGNVTGDNFGAQFTISHTFSFKKK